MGSQVYQISVSVVWYRCPSLTSRMDSNIRLTGLALNTGYEIKTSYWAITTNISNTQKMFQNSLDSRWTKLFETHCTLLRPKAHPAYSYIYIFILSICFTTIWRLCHLIFPHFLAYKLFLQRNIALKHHWNPKQKRADGQCQCDLTPKVQELKCQRSMVQRATLRLHQPGEGKVPPIASWLVR